jgi:hypothetical protein
MNKSVIYIVIVSVNKSRKLRSAGHMGESNCIHGSGGISLGRRLFLRSRMR